MIYFRFSFLLVIASALFGCEQSLSKFDNLFYQMSEADSLKSSEKLFQSLKQESIEYQNEYSHFNQRYETCFIPPYRNERQVFRVRLAGNGADSIDYHGISNDLTKSVVDFYLKNRNVRYSDLTDSERNSNFPFYNVYTPKGLKKIIEDRREEFEDVRETPDADPLIVEYFEEKVTSAEYELRMIEIFDVNSVFSIDVMCRVEIDCPNSLTDYNRILDSMVNGFYQLRNYECMRYFNESYLDLFERSARRKRQVDLDKLDALKWLCPVRIIDYKHTPESNVLIQVPLK